MKTNLAAQIRIMFHDLDRRLTMLTQNLTEFLKNVENVQVRRDQCSGEIVVFVKQIFVPRLKADL
jgi:hypothetical protein